MFLWIEEKQRQSIAYAKKKKKNQTCTKILVIDLVLTCDEIVHTP